LQDHAGLEPITTSAVDLVHTVANMSRLVFWHDRSSHCTINASGIFLVREVGSFLTDVDAVCTLLTAYMKPAAALCTITLCVTAKYTCVVLRLNGRTQAWRPLDPVLSEQKLRSLDEVQKAAAVHPVPLRMFGLTNLNAKKSDMCGIYAGYLKEVVVPLVHAAGSRAQVWLPPSDHYTVAVRVNKTPCNWGRCTLTNSKQFPLYAAVNTYERKARVAPHK